MGFVLCCTIAASIPVVYRRTMYKIEQVELSERVYRAIKQMILNKQLVSGQKLNQERLAAHLGVSRTPLLSAFSKLEQEMLVEILPRRGAFIRKLTRREFRDLHDIRMRLEPLGAAKAAECADKAEIAELRRRLARFEMQVQEPSHEKIRAADHSLHIYIMEMSANRMLHRMISSLSLIMLSDLEGLLQDPELSLQEHQGIVEAIAERDPQRAESLMYEHILAAGQNLDMAKSSGYDLERSAWKGSK